MSAVCWQCKDYVRGECGLHGPLLPCLEDITLPGTKKTAKFPVPSCIEIKESTIPRAGNGAFATQFIEPGSILGKLFVLLIITVILLATMPFCRVHLFYPTLIPFRFYSFIHMFLKVLI